MFFKKQNQVWTSQISLSSMHITLCAALHVKEGDTSRKAI